MSVNVTWKNYVEGTDEWLEEEALRSIRGALGPIADAVVAAIQREVPDYARPLEGTSAGGSDGHRGRIAPLCRRRAATRRGRRLPPAGRRRVPRRAAASTRCSPPTASARAVAWREISDIAAAPGASARSQRNLAEAVFAYIDRIAGESVEGYAEAQLRDAGDLDRRRAELAEMLLSGVATTTRSSCALPRQPAGRLPRTVACLAVAGERADRARRLLSGESLGVRDRRDDRHRRARTRSALEREAARLAERLELSVALGPTVGLEEVPRLDAPRPAGARARGAGAPPVIAERRLAEIALRGAPEVAALRRAPARAARRPDAREPRAAEATLLQWLRHRGAQGAIAASSAVHPQTVRYRMARLRDLDGGDARGSRAALRARDGAPR